jgi:nucleotide-binding universal stress UspA family protein
MQRIVVGVDAAGLAENAVTVGIELAQRFHAEIELVGGVPVSQMVRHMPPEQALAEARRALRVKLEATLPGALLPYLQEEHRIVVESGHPAMVLLQRAAVPGTGLVVIGAHRRRGLLDLHNTAHLLISHATCPVWVQEGPVREIRRILVPVDLSEESLAALRTACTWAVAFGARVTALHCFVSPELSLAQGYPSPGPPIVLDSLRDEAQREFEQAMAAFPWGSVPHEAVFLQATPALQVLHMQDRTDLIMMGTHGRTGLSGMILGNVARAVIHEAHVPVVTLRVPGRRWLL